jgi:hypothetical protein
MILAQKPPLTTSVKTATTTQYIKPTVTQAEAITAQQAALAAVTPATDAESVAVQTQKDLLDNFATVDKQQSVVTTQYVAANPVNFTPSSASVEIGDAGAEAAIKALATDANRDKLVNAVKYGVDMWRLQAHFQNIQIMGQTAIGTPGCLTGPSLKPWITQAPGVYSATGYFKTLVNAVAEGVSVNFNLWMNSVTVPGLPWYPWFVAFPGPFAPPTPNIPMPLQICVSVNQSKLMSPSQVETALKSNLPSTFLLAEMDIFLYTTAVYLSNYFTTWLISQNVMMVMGMGPVPTYSPPYVPVGSVVNGYVIPSPGHLAA